MFPEIPRPTAGLSLENHEISRGNYQEVDEKTTLGVTRMIAKIFMAQLTATDGDCSRLFATDHD